MSFYILLVLNAALFVYCYCMEKELSNSGSKFRFKGVYYLIFVVLTVNVWAVYLETKFL